MGYQYKQLSLEERCTISRLHEDRKSIRQIAKAFDRQPSTIGRELKRNRLKTKCYMPSYASSMANARRWTGSRLERQPAYMGVFWVGPAANAGFHAIAVGTGAGESPCP